MQINKGGFTGMTVWVKWKEGKSSTYLSLTGLGIGNATYPYGSVGASINTGRLNFIETDLGLLLTRLLTKCN